ncbi:MAG: surface antigen [Oceanicoccus sp.]|jgi:surface antigen
MNKMLIIIMAFAFASSTVQASNLSFLQDSVLASFDKDDAASFKQFIAEALGTLPDKAVKEWHSQHSDLKGKIKPKVSFNANDTRCRRTAFLVARNKQTEQYHFDVCLQNNKWQVTPTPITSFTKADWVSLGAAGSEALDQAVAGMPFYWFSEKNKNSAVFVPMGIVQSEGRECRDLAISISDKKGRSSNGRYNFCKDSSGLWLREIEGF